MANINFKNFFIQFTNYEKQLSFKEFLLSVLLASINNNKYVTALNIPKLKFSNGDKVGIIGKNGAGKSTLLKCISGLYETYNGTLSVNGSIAPLLEIGAGFHPEFNAEDNIFLNGSLLGIPRSFLEDNVDQILEYAGLGSQRNKPIKHFSSGMISRLGFSIASSYARDILLLDEVFAGGDKEFKHKSKLKIKELINKSQIMLLVSHDMDIITDICNRAILIDSGLIIMDDKPNEVIDYYKKHY